ncbi:hypothetical protein DIU31_009745 [Mucilaginibacter rubeus]|uniref:IPT/TIG domain-containing protein n=1 Tax=Mucilaginibacter rubeus TaxID=2027860 RepID=A0AAE6JEV3_9SPHI|nr:MULTISPECIES: IPT/TIG domain-containing protein [Mucilaginibacter]QEM03780.1 hypothetical protein DIU31_009745 [Mucilaginibacter rubeus]QEM16392.1 hypothetical protein DIU38_009845 [Mucilaginibacter gossypii]QTE40841.1 IPT/TIG domain-containing protein [Mucilaginibacter rubeus]QTE47444.1 IPT/TIG domain-containing protein [Mucilaginibacter rubeus]QTE61705.1 IPT/TIG domain-containing protein [Mucilaginibacter rubeus]
MQPVTKYLSTAKVPLLIALLLIISTCKKQHTERNGDGSSPDLKPTILSLSTYTGPYRTVVQIKGSGFDPDTRNNKVWFNGKPAEITAATETIITAIVPLSAGTGNISLSVSGAAKVTGPVFNYQYTMMVTTLASYVRPLGSTDPNLYQLMEWPTGIAVDGPGNVYVSDFHFNMIYRIDTTGKAIVFSGQVTSGFVNGTLADARYNFPGNVATDHAGNIYVIDNGNGAFRKIDNSGTVTTFASSKFGGVIGSGGYEIFPGINTSAAIVTDKNNTLYFSDSNGIIRTLTQTGDVALFAGYSFGYRDGPRLKANFSYLSGLTFDANGNLYVADWGNNAIRKIDTQGNVTTLAGSTVPGYLDGKGTAARFSNPTGIVADAGGNIYVAEPINNVVRKVTPNGTVSTFAGIPKRTGNSDGNLTTATFNAPTNIAIDKNGILYVTDRGNKSIRKIGLQ